MRERPTVLLGVTGSVAAYKAPMVARALVREGVRVVPVLTRSAQAFVGASTLAGVTQEAVRTDAFEPGTPGELHVELAASADVVAIVPATADVLARLASGRADDLLTATCLSARGPVIVAPAMHPHMWSHPATQRNVRTLEADGRVRFVGPVVGEVASGDRGEGRMEEPDAIARAILEALGAPRSAPTGGDLAGVRLLVSAGPTVEDLDPVRFLGNRSTGKMGFAIAERAARRGAVVTLVTGPVSLPTPPGVRRIDVRSALSMQDALHRELGADQGAQDALVMAAAVGDYRFAQTFAEKVKRSGATLSLELVPNPDVLAGIGAARAGVRPVLVGFAVETADDAGIVELARKKLHDKRVDLVVGNHAAESFGHETNRAALVTADGASWTDTADKRALADAILDRVLALLGPGAQTDGA